MRSSPPHRLPDGTWRRRGVSRRPLRRRDASGRCAGGNRLAAAPGAGPDQREFVDVSDGQAGLAVFSRGCRSTRSCATGRPRLRSPCCAVWAASRGRSADPAGSRRDGFAHPRCGMSGRHTFELAVRPHAGDWHTIYRDATVFAALSTCVVATRQRAIFRARSGQTTFDPPLRGFASSRVTSGRSARASFLSLSPAALVLSAVKRGEMARR